MNTRPKVVVLGAGFGGLESAFYLRYRLKDSIDLTVVSDHDYFLFKPNTIYIPFGDEPEKFRIRLEKPMRRQDIRFVQAQVRAVELEKKAVVLDEDGQSPVSYDYLIVATGADMRAHEVPGLKNYAHTVWSPDDMLELRNGFQQLVEEAKAGNRQRLLFLVPPNNRCSGPLYEMVMMVDTWLRRPKARDPVEITWTTYKDGFIQAFGPRLNTVVTEEFQQ